MQNRDVECRIPALLPDLRQYLDAPEPQFKGRVRLPAQHTEIIRLDPACLRLADLLGGGRLFVVRVGNHVLQRV
jgi:hypothetical protein